MSIFPVRRIPLRAPECRSGRSPCADEHNRARFAGRSAATSHEILVIHFRVMGPSRNWLLTTANRQIELLVF